MQKFLFLLKPTHRIFINSKFNDSKCFSIICNYNPYDKIKSLLDNEVKSSLTEDIIYSNETLPKTTHYIRVLNISSNKMCMISVFFPSYSSEEIAIELQKHIQGEIN